MCPVAASPTERPCGLGTIPCGPWGSHGRARYSVICHFRTSKKCRHFACLNKCRHFVTELDVTTRPAAEPGPPRTGTLTTIVLLGTTTVSGAARGGDGAHRACAVNECAARKFPGPFHDVAPAVTVCEPS